MGCQAEHFSVQLPLCIIYFWGVAKSRIKKTTLQQTRNVMHGEKGLNPKGATVCPTGKTYIYIINSICTFSQIGK